MADNLLLIPSSFYRCAGPNCGVLKGASDLWWVMWSSFGDYEVPVMHLAPWNEKLSEAELSAAAYYVRTFFETERAQ